MEDKKDEDIIEILATSDRAALVKRTRKGWDTIFGKKQPTGVN